MLSPLQKSGFTHKQVKFLYKKSKNAMHFVFAHPMKAGAGKNTVLKSIHEQEINLIKLL